MSRQAFMFLLTISAFLIAILVGFFFVSYFMHIDAKEEPVCLKWQSSQSYLFRSVRCVEWDK